MVVFAAGFPAIYGRQPLYFKDVFFDARSKVPPPPKSDGGNLSLNIFADLKHLNGS